VEVPHDWSIEGPWDEDNPGDQQQGFAPGGIGWYRRDLPDDVDGDQVYLRFGGVYRDSDVYVDGEHAGNRPNGYTSFHYDLSGGDADADAGGETLAVRADNDEYPHCRWYTGSGIYRDVELVETAALHVVPWGTDIRTPAVTDRSARVEVATELRNAADDAATGRLETVVLDPDGKVVATAETPLDVGAGAETTVDQTLTVEDPERWSVEDPTQYAVRSVVHRADGGDAEPVDDYVTPFGIRTFEWTADEGFFLNGEGVTLTGVNLHHDAGALGAAVPERALERRLEALQEIGCNAIRTAHNPPQTELLDLADRMGFLVIDEAFDKWRHEGTDRFFDEWWREDLAAMVRRDRNHPSVVCWSVGNEIYDQAGDQMLEDLAMLSEATSELDPTRPVTYGNPPWGEDAADIVDNLAATSEHVDVVSCNYCEPWYDDLRECVDKPVVGSECKPYFLGGGDEDLAFVPENPWFAVAENDYVAGQFIWSGIDYLGESREWPNKGWATGMFDTCAVPKPETGFHESVWSDEPMVQIAAEDRDRERPDGRPSWSWPALGEHWTFPDREDKRDFVHVFTFTNAETVDLYLNDEWLGAQDLADNPDGMIEWYVPYESGTLRAEATEDGEVVATHELETAGEPDRVELDLDREALAADGRDLVYAEATVVDEDGTRVPRASHEVDFDVAGAGEIAGVDNGDLDSDEPFVGSSRSAFHGTCFAVVQAARDAGEVEIAAATDGLDGDRASIPVREVD
ncbi:MAG: glycoside hydrolase family 2 TIM barrel-domain containing protein, partial [Haloarculaceae archaeon]